MVLKKGPLPLFIHVTSKKAPTFYTYYAKILIAESNLNFSFCLEISHCKLFEII